MLLSIRWWSMNVIFRFPFSHLFYHFFLFSVIFCFLSRFAFQCESILLDKKNQQRKKAFCVFGIQCSFYLFVRSFIRFFISVRPPIVRYIGNGLNHLIFLSSLFSFIGSTNTFNNKNNKNEYLLGCLTHSPLDIHLYLYVIFFQIYELFGCACDRY